MNVKPLKKKVLVAQNASATKSAGGIILEGSTSLSESKRGTVLAVGPDVTLVKVGDVILLEWSKSQVVKIEDSERVMVDEDNIVAVLEKE